MTKDLEMLDSYTESNQKKPKKAHGSPGDKYKIDDPIEMLIFKKDTVELP